MGVSKIDNLSFFRIRRTSSGSYFCDITLGKRAMQVIFLLLQPVKKATVFGALLKCSVEPSEAVKPIVFDKNQPR